MNGVDFVSSIAYSMYAITSELSPAPGPTGGSSSGIQILQADTFKLQSFQTPTGSTNAKKKERKWEKCEREIERSFRFCSTLK
jgi:hypothetical protein